MQGLVTVFGGSGFVGAQVVRALAQPGSRAGGLRIRVAVRNVGRGYKLRMLGDVGQIEIVQANVRNPASIARALDGAEAVVNLAGVAYEAGRQRFLSVHVMGARNIAEAAKARGLTNFVHVSALGADPDSPSKYARSKGEGEKAVRELIPEATIIRPSFVFGQGDSFFNRLGELAAISPVQPLFGGGKARCQPVYVGDVAAAIARCVHDPATRGQTYELGGPAVYTQREIAELVRHETGRRTILAPLPVGLARGLGKVGQMAAALFPPPLTVEMVELLTTDNVVSGQLPGLAELGVQPTAVEPILPTYLYRFRKGGQFAEVEARV